ncbi:MAG TPA: hypothetical protein VKB69_00235, partial [Micromonosporaceae bacterium]|nr:hypothetical protein [Micromonosporaceae bacterium]
MSIVLIVAGILCVAGAGLVGLLRLGLPRRAVAPICVAVAGITLITIGALVFHGRQDVVAVAPEPSPRYVPTGTTPTDTTPTATTPTDAYTPPTLNTPPAAVPVDGAGCGYTPGKVYASPPSSIDANAGLPRTGPSDVQRLPSQLDPGLPAGATLVESTWAPFATDVYDEQTAIAIAPSLTDLNATAYDDLSLTDMGGIPFMQLAVGTPKPGLCWYKLATTAVTSFEGPGSVFA